MHLGAGLGELAIADRVEEEIAQRLVGEGTAEDVKDLAAVCRSLLLDLFEESLEDLALPGVGGDEVPESADLLLADAVHATEALLDAVGIPREVVVDHEVGGLEVETLTGGIGRDEHTAYGVLGEFLCDPATFGAADATVHGLDGFRAAEEIADLLHEIVEGVAVLGEDDELARAGGRVEDVVLEDRAELGPLDVLSGSADSGGEGAQVLELVDLQAQLLDGAGTGGRVDDLLLEFLEILAAPLVLVEVERSLEGGVCRRRGDAVFDVVGTLGEARDAALE